jgi:hypothetical protein
VFSVLRCVGVRLSKAQGFGECVKRVFDVLVPGLAALVEVASGDSVDVLYASNKLKEVFAKLYTGSADIVFRIIDRKVREACFSSD